MASWKKKTNKNKTLHINWCACCEEKHTHQHHSAQTFKWLNIDNTWMEAAFVREFNNIPAFGLKAFLLKQVDGKKNQKTKGSAQLVNQ